MGRQKHTGRDARPKELAEAERVAALSMSAKQTHPTAVAADPTQLRHINTYGALPEFYIDQPFTCRTCGKREIWRASDQKWYVETAKGHIDAKAVRCHACRVTKKS